ncbi:hypothetical protein [Limnobacter sp.]|uniref:hypothetical protein n=1 Tax=Limnobacter sp. TaxID=2003368 RepID=UPI0025C3AB96|nr:hypothetical protein [Limnobacter sp.]
MANFGINLDLRLNGQNAVDRAIRGARALEDIVRRINDKPLNLANIGGAARLEGLGEARKKVIQLAKDLNKGTKSVGKTEVAIRDTISAFSELAANTEKGTGVFNEFTAVVQKAEKELNDIARATENARRAQKGLMSLEDREAQLERRANLLRTLRTKKKLKEEEARARKKNSDAIDRENKKLERQRKIDERAEKRRAGRIATNFAAGAGFPLLFGGGPGAVIGGTLGAFGGFGGSVLGGALGQQLDKLGQAALNTGEVFNKLTKNVDQLIPKLGTSTQPGFAGTAEFLVSQGRGSEVATAARNAFEDAYGAGALKRFQELGRTSKEFNQVMAELGVQLQDFISGPLRGLLEAIKKVTGTGGQTPAEKARSRFEGDVAALAPRIEQLQGQDRLSMSEEKELNTLLAQREGLYAVIAQYTREINGETSKNLTLNKILQDVLRQQESIQRQETDLVRTRLTARRDSFAQAQGQLAVEKAQNDLTNVQKQLTEEDNRENKDTLLILQLQNQVKEKSGILDRARLDLVNSITLAERQIMVEQITGAASQIKAIRQEERLELQYQQGRQGRFALFEAETKLLNDEFVSNGLVLDLERKRALIGVTEAERISSINRDYDLRVRLLEKEFNLNKQNLEQAKAAYDLSRLQVEQALKMERMQAGISAAQQIRATSPFEQERFLPNPFFGESAQLQVEQTLRYNESLALLNQELSDVVARQNEFLAPGVREQLEDQEKKIRNQIAAFKEYQPAIDAAALAQARFNEAMAITVPVTDSLFDSLLSVVEGTKTAEQAFADFLRSIASLLMDAAKQMIATYIAIGIARMFAGVPAKTGGSEAASKAGSAANLAGPKGDFGLGSGPGFGNPADFLPGGRLGRRALGGAVGAGQPYMVGERGPELFVPGAMGNIVPNNAMGGSSIVVNVDASGSSVEGNADQASQLGKVLGAAVQAELIKQKRPGGLLAS